MSLTFEQRASLAKSPAAKRLFELMAHKKTNLALSADVTSADELLKFANMIGPEICVLKTHIDIIDDFTPSLTEQLKALSSRHQFFIFEDRKFADIGNTVMHQFGGGIYRIADWADIVNAHVLPGPGIIKGLQEAVRDKQCGLILLAEMSSAGHLMDQDYIHATLNIAEHHADFVFGFITQRAVSKDPHWINMTPGVKLEKGIDKLGQQYVTPEMAIKDHGSDIIIVGRGILAAADPLKEARAYREAGWNAYLKRLP